MCCLFSFFYIPFYDFIHIYIYIIIKWNTDKFKYIKNIYIYMCVYVCIHIYILEVGIDYFF